MTPSEIDELERLMTAARDLAWHEERNGTRAEQEAEDAELDAELARVFASGDGECYPDLLTAARAVCARLGIPDVEVPS